MKVRIYLILMVTAILIPVVIFSTAALNMLLRAEREAALRGARESARAIKLAVDRELGNAQTALRLLSASRNLDESDWRNFYKQAMVADPDDATWIALVDEDGRQIVNTREPFGAPLPTLPHPERVRQAIEAQTMQVSNLLTSPLDGQYMVAVALPVTFDGERHYVLAQSFLARYFERVLAQPGIPRDWIIGIFDRDGRTVARSHRAEEYVGKPVQPEVAQAARTATEGVMRNRSREGTEIYTVFTRSELSGWSVALGVPVQQIEASARRAVIIAGLGLLAALACAGGVGLFFTRRLSRSLGGAVASATALGRGEAPSLARSSVAEVNRLYAALTDAGEVLMRERQSRALAEAERSRLLANEQKARELAQVQNKAKDEFLAMLGHELRNPLNAIGAAISVMEIRGMAAEKIERAHAILRRQSEHLGRIVDDLLDLSRVTSGNILLVKQRIDLADVVRESLATLAATGAAQQHIVNLHADSAWVDADPTRLEQIVSNLLGNAVKYTPAGGRIDIDVRPLKEEAVFVVRDSGIGMSEQLLSNVFETFVQGPAQLDRAQGGLGIGLALVRRLVVLHGGEVTAESPGIGKGSTFTVRLPLVPLAQEALLS